MALSVPYLVVAFAQTLPSCSEGLVQLFQYMALLNQLRKSVNKNITINVYMRSGEMYAGASVSAPFFPHRHVCVRVKVHKPTIRLSRPS